jgi:tRNA pseudouridine38-40 synthase
VRNIKLTIEYDGTDYEGWQVQNASKSVLLHLNPRGEGPSVFKPRGSTGRKARTVQSAIETVLRRILKEKVKLNGSGRTDAGVHACAQVANFFTASSIPLEGLHKGLNALLPCDISVSAVEAVSLDFHSRCSARWKLYRYTILNRAYPSSLKRNVAYFCDYPLNVAAMKREAQALKGRHNFKSFHSSDIKKKSSVRTIRAITVMKSGDEIVISIEANGFLKHMVRTIVGTLIAIGRGNIPAGSMKRILKARDRKAAGPTAPPQGLCLMRVMY